MIDRQMPAAVIFGFLALVAWPVPFFCKASADTLAQIKVPQGSELYREHCAQCHGADGTGDGPMAKVLTVHPANLTAISKSNGGTFPAERIAEIIRYGGDIQAHGERAMPIWGKVFSLEGGTGKGGAAFSRRAVIELKSYIQSIQSK
ncbi:MAG: cytochrome c [Hyphomicrobium sp.]|uniref:c-type cytochrome n=1 Tax=Hyphomicrobium sp. TaxID=82 RepID=UPI0039E2A7D9